VTSAVVERLQAAYEGFGRKDIDAVLEVMDEDIEWDATDAFAHTGVYKGHEGVREYITSLSDTWESFGLVPDQFIDSGDGRQVMVLGEIRGRLRGSGEQVAARFAHVLRVEDGKVAKLKICLDRAAAQKELGGVG
jgi:uncharacterized protein